MSAPVVAGPNPCLMCDADSDPTVEHIIPQTLWKRFGIDPDREDLATFRTSLCYRHNQATGALHRRDLMMQLIETGEPVTRQTLLHLGDWAVWVTLLLGLARGSGVLGAKASRDLLLQRFDAGTGPPSGVRVYAARVKEYVPGGPPTTPYVLALRGDSRILLDEAAKPIGLTVREGPMNASESIGLGEVALLVVGSTYASGPDHLHLLDRAAASVGLDRIHPLSDTLPALTRREISMKNVHGLFTVVPFGADPSLLPPRLQWL